MVDLISPTPVRLIIVTDWDVGFQLTSNARSLDDVPPGGEYVTECVPQGPVVIREVIVEGFSLVQISVGKETAETKLVSAGKDFQYRLNVPLDVLGGEHIHLRLRNNVDFPRKPKVATLVRYYEADRTNEER